LIAGNQTARFDLLNRLLLDTDLVTLPNSRGENILLFLVQTVGRQLIEQRQYRPSRVRSSGAAARKHVTTADLEPEMPEHNLEPPRFSRRALERILSDWTAVKAMLLTGCKERKPNSSTDVLFEDQLYLNSQNGSSRLDKFTHCFLVKCSVEMLDSLLTTLIREMQCETVEGRRAEARRVAARFVRSVARIFVILNAEMTPQSSSKKRLSVNVSQPLMKCKRVFQALINVAIEELCETADSLIAPVRLGVARPTASFSLVSSNIDAIQGTEELFSIDPLPARSPSVDTLTHIGSGQAAAVSSFLSRPHTPIPASVRVDGLRQLRHVNVERLDEELVGPDAEMEVMESIVGDADHLDHQSEHDDHDHHSEHSDHDPNAADQEGGGESDMELDLLGESESDSDESTHSHNDNASIQRSAITAATAGSDAGVGSLPYFSDDEEDSGDSSSQDDKSDGGESDDNDADVGGLLEEQLERRTNTGGQRTLQAPHTMQWAVRQHDATAGPAASLNTSSTRPATTAVAAATTGSSGIIYIDPSSLRRTTTLPTVTAATNLPTNQDNPVTMSTTVSQLSRAFGVVIRQIADLLMMLQDYHALVPNLPRVLDITSNEIFDLQVYLEFHLKPTWDWLINVMDATEAQLRFGSVLSSVTNPAHPSHPLHASYIRNLRSAEQISRSEQHTLTTIDNSRRRTARMGIGSGGPAGAGGVTTVGVTNADGHSARRDFLTYALSLMRSHNDEHADNLPTLDIASLKHVAYVLDALVYYMRSGGGGDVDSLHDGAGMMLLPCSLGRTRTIT